MATKTKLTDAEVAVALEGVEAIRRVVDLLAETSEAYIERAGSRRRDVLGEFVMSFLDPRDRADLQSISTRLAIAQTAMMKREQKRVARKQA